MKKRLYLSAIVLTILIGVLLSVSVYAKVEDEEEIPGQIGVVQSVYVPEKTYFVSHSTQKWVGEDNIDGDITKGCFEEGTENSHGRFGGLWESMGFSKYVFYNVFGEIPNFGYHCNASELNDKVEVIGRYATACKYLRGEIDGTVNAENVKSLISKAKQGDIIVISPAKKCSSTGKAMIYISSNEAAVNVYHADWTGSCEVTESSITYDALAMYHCITLLRSTNYPYPQPVPPSAVEAVELDSKDLSLNESVTITWPMVKRTENYTVSYLDSNGERVGDSETVSTAFLSHSFANAGSYRVSVTANNKYGVSNAVYSEEIVVHNRNIVTFLDYDGTVIALQKVDYGKNATAPSVPGRIGYKFAGWDCSLENITEPCEITATYEINKYTVKFYNPDGTHLATQTVEYGGSAVPPTDYIIESGYIFSGWHITYDSDGTSYDCVDGDMKLYATQCWENENLPIIITINNCVLQEDGGTYKTNLTLKNYNLGTTSFKLIATLKTSAGKDVKTAVTQEFTLAPNESVTLDDSVIYSDFKVNRVEYVAVGIVNDSKTGGAYSKKVSSGITALKTWGAWTDWTTEDLRGNYEGSESKTQWSYRNKIYSESSDGSWGAPWNKYNTASVWSDWSAWSNWQTGAVSKSDICEVETRTTYRYYHFHCTKCGSRYPYWGISCYNCGAYISESTWAERWNDCSYSSLAQKGKRLVWNDYKYFTTAVEDGGRWFWETAQNNYRTEYRYRTRTMLYTYYYWKWSDWSVWYDYNPGGDEVTTRTVFRYRNQVDLSDPSAGIEDTSGKQYMEQGIIPEVDGNLSGKLATVMVYKKTNTDPTEEQLEFVDQITIGDGNTYLFNFIPREEPSAETGDFMIALGIEGANRLINIDAIKANEITYTVKFFANGIGVGAPQTIVKGASAIAPEAPEIEGYDFVKWSDSATNIQDNMEVFAVYELKDCEITYVDFEEGQVTSLTQKYGTEIVYPELSELPGIKRRYWDTQEAGVTTVEGNIIITTKCENEIYSVKFYDAAGNELTDYTQNVEFGNSAIIPEIIPTKEGMKFAQWSGDCAVSCITQNVEFTPVFVYAETTDLPKSSIVSTNADGSKVVELSCDTEHAEIYYVIHTVEEESIDVLELFEKAETEDALYEKVTLTLMDVEEEPELASKYEFKEIAQKYTGEITLAPNQTITYVAYSEGKNSSLPVSDEFSNDLPDYVTMIGENTLRQYKNSIEGKTELLVYNDCPSFDTGVFVLCLYDKRGIMIDLIPLNTDIQPGLNKAEFDVNVCDINKYQSDSITAKVIGVLSGEDIAPICDVIEFTIE